MSIERLEEIRISYLELVKEVHNTNDFYLIDNFMLCCIDTFKDQSDQIADLQNQIEQGKG